MKKILPLATVVVICGLGAVTFAAEVVDQGKPPETSHSEPEAAAHKEKDGKEPAHATCPVCPVHSPEEFTVLMRLRERAAEMDARESVIERREHAVAALEKELDHEVAKLDDKVVKLEKRLNLAEPGHEEQEKRIASLVESISGLTAKKAAPILAETDAAAAAELLHRMDPAKVSALLAIMPAAKAGEFITLGIGKKNAAAAPPQASSAAPKAPEASP